MPDNRRYATLLQASLLADSLTLPAHWIYDPAVISARFGRITTLQVPPADSYHAGQPLGGQTHYGVQALTLMESLGGHDRFDPVDFSERWQALWQGEPGYRDGATRTTLANLAAGLSPEHAGSPSGDLAGAARIAALIVALRTVPSSGLTAASQAQTMLTHRDPAVSDAAAFLVRAVRYVLADVAVPEALNLAAQADYAALPVADHLQAAKAAAAQGGVAAVQALGPACAVAGALPATLALALAYPDDLEGALVENVAAGGDSAARGLALGMLLGATANASLPAPWLEQWQARNRVDAFLTAQGLTGA